MRTGIGFPFGFSSMGRTRVPDPEQRLREAIAEGDQLIGVARTKAGELMIEDQAANREAITELGLQYAIMTPFTSFVAVEHQTISDGGKLRTIEVPVEVPEGVAGDVRIATVEIEPVIAASWSTVNGFCSSATPGSNTPLCTIALRV